MSSVSLPEIPEDIGDIVAWHSHIYFTPETHHIALRLNEELQDNFKIWDYRWLDAANGLHPTPMFRFAILKEDFQRYVEWILKARAGLVVLVHAITGDDYVDHTYLALWIGEKYELGVERMREAALKAKAEGKPAISGVFETGRNEALAGQIRFRPGDDIYKIRNQPTEGTQA
ncbi:DOPA 4,5-dioxygenase family protein [Asticcacaulis tiandongensis]|uniref:DOPA 4,5-dioxygenase family protein n=1 Tax=Asticcacaulis tiandongensis TaxID=2565365 RepID=UPI0015E83163|nr:DOPA 4,5-dioxygenase family protein [Asticcacaulis tiandongensis]